MNENKTKASGLHVSDYLKTISNNERLNDIFKLIELFKEITNEEPLMWGDSIIGFGSYHYKYASGREGDWFLAGISSRRQSITLYVSCKNDGWSKIADLGKFKVGKSCLYIKRLSDINLEILKDVIYSSIYVK